MKTLVTLVAALSLSMGMYAQDGKTADPNKTSHEGRMKKDHVMMKNGKMMTVMGGKMTPMDHDMTMSDGSVVMTDGTVKMKDGNTKKLQEGEGVEMNGTWMKAHHMNK